MVLFSAHCAHLVHCWPFTLDGLISGAFIVPLHLPIGIVKQPPQQYLLIHWSPHLMCISCTRGVFFVFLIYHFAAPSSWIMGISASPLANVFPAIVHWPSCVASLNSVQALSIERHAFPPSFIGLCVFVSEICFSNDVCMQRSNGRRKTRHC